MGKDSVLVKVRGVLAFLIGIFGAMAILGVFFKILKLDNYELFMKVGFIGEAAAFVVMGILELLTTFGESAETSTTEIFPGFSLPSNFAEAVDAKLDARLDEMLLHFATDIDRFRGEMNSLASEIAHSRQAVHEMRAQLQAVSSGDLAGDAQRLGHGMSVLGSEMAGAGKAAEIMRRDLEVMVNRFRNFNGVTTNSGADQPAIARRSAAS